MKTKLWQKNVSDTTEHEKIVEKFTVGNDIQFDLLLAEHDIIGTKAHVAMLTKIGFILVDENVAIQQALDEMLIDAQSGRFIIEDGVEDVHSQIEANLTIKLGEAGKKIHTGRSRNDQVLLAIKLYLCKEIKEIAADSEKLFNRLIELSKKHQNDLLPGYTHFQIAMPSSFGLWFSAYAESLVDDFELLIAAYNVCNKNPLGSGAGYGSSFPLDRKYTTELLKMQDMNYNSVYAQMTRGKSEKILAMAMSSIASTLSKFSYDICLYMNQDFSFITFPDHLTTGSSIMPHKKNPDVFELIRAKCNKTQGCVYELNLLTNNLPSGYHRDFQLTKEILFPAITSLKECIAMMEFMLQHIIIKKDILDKMKYKHIYSVEEVNKLVLKGKSFREAYVEVGKNIESNNFEPTRELNHTHEGSIGNLQLDKIEISFKKLLQKLNKS